MSYDNPARTPTGSAARTASTSWPPPRSTRAPGVSLIASAWRRLRRDPVFLLGLGITVAFVVLAIISPWIAPHDPAAAPLLDKVRPQSNPVPGRSRASRSAPTTVAATCCPGCSSAAGRP